jgi:predicted transport protein
MTSAGPEDMMAAMAASMKGRTGRTVEEWVALVASAGPEPLDQQAVRRWLRDEHGVPQNSQWAIADAAARAAGWLPPTLEEYVDGQYQGPKAVLRPIFDRLREAIESLGDDVRIEGRATYIPFVRRRQFAAVQAATRTRVDVGLRFTDTPDSELLRPADAPGQATHRLSLTGVDQVDDDVRSLLRAAYEQNG